MLPIYICEDEAAIRNHIASHISTFYSIHQELGCPKISSYANPEELLAALKDSSEMGIYMLDIRLKGGISGLQLAKQIRLKDPRGFIVFITAYSEYAPTTFKLQVEAFGYIEKGSSNFNALISSTLMRIHERYEAFQKRSGDNPRVQFTGNRHVYYCYANELITVMTTDHSHRIEVFTTNSSFKFNGSLKAIRQNLPSSHFLQCHRSYIVNKYHVNSYNADSHMAELSNHMKVPVAREHRPFFLQFVGNNENPS